MVFATHWHESAMFLKRKLLGSKQRNTNHCLWHISLWTSKPTSVSLWTFRKIICIRVIGQDPAPSNPSQYHWYESSNKQHSLTHPSTQRAKSLRTLTRLLAPSNPTNRVLALPSLQLRTQRMTRIAPTELSDSVAKVFMSDGHTLVCESMQWRPRYPSTEGIIPENMPVLG